MSTTTTASEKKSLWPLVTTVILSCVAVCGVLIVQAVPPTPEQIEQQRVADEQHRIELERERVKQAEAAEREQVRQSYLQVEEYFGSLLMRHTVNYRGISEQSKKNGMYSTDGLRGKRDAEVFAWFTANKFRFSMWEAQIVKISGPAEQQCPPGMTPCINLAVKMTTPNGVVLHATVAKLPQYVSLLTNSKVGDVLVINGRFVPAAANSALKFGDDMVVKPGKMEVSITDYGSMDDPEYQIVIDSMNKQ